MKTYLLTVALGCLLVAGFVGWIDPYSRWHRQIATPDKRLGPDDIWLWPTPNIDERRIKHQLWTLQTAPDIILVGSSRVMQVGSAFFGTGWRLRNAAVNSAGVEDYAAAWQEAKSSGKIPRYMVLFIDPWVLNGNVDFKGWNANSSLAVAFEHEQGLPVSSSWIQRFQTWGDYGSALLNWPTLKESLLWLRAHIRQDSLATRTTVPRSAMPADCFGYSFDGSAIFPAWMSETPSPSAIHGIVQQSLQTTGLNNMARWTVDSRRISVLAAILKDLRVHHVRTMIILPPLQNEAYREIPKIYGFSRTFEDFRRSIRQSEEGETALNSVCDVLDPADVGCTDTEFRDPVHMLESCTRKVIQACFQSADWKPLLSSANASDPE